MVPKVVKKTRDFCTIVFASNEINREYQNI